MRRAVHLVLLVGFAVVESDASDSDCPGSKPTSTAQRFALEANNAASRGDMIAATACMEKAVAKKNADGKLKREYSSKLGQWYMQSNRLEDAVRAFRLAVAAVAPPDFMDLFHLSAMLHNTKQYTEASKVYTQLIKLNSNVPEVRLNYGMCLEALSDLKGAKQQLEKAIKLRPTMQEAQKALATLGQKREGSAAGEDVGALLQQLSATPAEPGGYAKLGAALLDGREWQAALRTYKTLMRLGRTALAFYGMGNVFERQQQYRTALRLFKHPKLLKDFEFGHHSMFNIGTTHNNLAEYDEAVYWLRQSIRLKPNSGHPYVNLGVAFKSLGRYQDAIQAYRDGIAAAAAPEAYSNLAALLSEVGSKAEAVDVAQDGVNLSPNSAHAYNILGVSLREAGRADEADRTLREALRIDAGFSEAAMNIVEGLIGSEKFDDARSVLETTLKARWNGLAFCQLFIVKTRNCAWGATDEYYRGREQLEKTMYEQLQQGSKPCMQPFQASIYPVSGDLVYSLSKAWASKEVYRANAMLKAPLAPHPIDFSAGRGRLRLGYISHDLNKHPLAYLFQHVFGYHDRKQFEVFAYSTKPDDGSSFHRLIRASTEQFIDVYQLTEDQQALRVNADRINVLIDLNGWTAGQNIAMLAMKACPIQVLLGVGYFGTSGIAEVNAFHSDRITSPPEFHQNFYLEKLMYVPPPYQVNDFLQSYQHVLEYPDISDRSAFSLPNDAVVFANFNNLQKLEPRVFDGWTDILKAVPHSLLQLLDSPAEAQKHIRERLAERGIVQERLLFAPLIDPSQNLKRMGAVDIVLDTVFGFNGHTTTADILWAGVPVLTMAHYKMPSRVSAALLSGMGSQLSNVMIANTYDEYINIAIALGKQAQARKKMRTLVREQRKQADTFNTPKWTRNLERGVKISWDMHATVGASWHSSIAAESVRR